MFTRSYPIVPVPKPRMTSGRGTQHTAAAERYWAFKDECSLRGVTLESGDGIVFVLPMPRSWSKAKRDRINARPHLQAPDLSNLLKALEDAVHENDSHLWHYSDLRKVWGFDGEIVITRHGQQTVKDNRR